MTPADYIPCTVGKHKSKWLCRPFAPWEGCCVCWEDEDRKHILLCDKCDSEYHIYCLDPPLEEVPEGIDILSLQCCIIILPSSSAFCQPALSLCFAQPSILASLVFLIKLGMRLCSTS